MPRVPLLLAALLVAPLFPLLPASADDAPCADARQVPGLGLACPRADGLLDAYDADGTYAGSLHGPDPIPPLDPLALPLAARAPQCAAGVPGDYYIIAIYARAYDDADQYATKQATIRSLVERANGMVHDAVVATGGASADLKVHCTNGVITVKNEVLLRPLSQSHFSGIVVDLRNRGYNDPHVKYWVFFDDGSACSCGGMAHVVSDSSPTPLNLNNGNYLSMFAVNFGYDSTRIWLHELAHTLGAVQNDAPHSTGGFHCTDGRDTMCYNDGGPNAWKYTTSACGTEVFDCGKDDYCHAAPASGTYLANHWNLCGSANRYVVLGHDPLRTACDEGVCP